MCNSVPSSSGTLLSCGTDTALGLWQREWQDRAEHSSIFGQGEVHFTTRPLTHPPTQQLGAEFTGPLTQALWGVLSDRGQGRRLPCVPSSHPSVGPSSLRQPLLSLLHACWKLHLPWSPFPLRAATHPHPETFYRS